jgi:hypothetical protein
MIEPEALFFHQFPDCATDNKDGDLAIVPDHQVCVRHLTVVHFRTK